MPSLGVITIVLTALLAGLVWLLLRFRSQDALEAIAIKRRASCKLVTRGCYIEGMEKIDVVMSLTDDEIYYDNVDLQASLDLAQLDEIEYDDETSTGHSVTPGRALRLRSHGRCLEFVLTFADAGRWEAMLPPHQQNQGHARAV